MTPDELRAWRAERNLSQRALAERIGWHWRTIQEYEAGNMPIPRKFELAMIGLNHEGSNGS
ncbi:MAG: helix-turn-helix transcriptional regulator [Candidatus Brocadiales bacterium]|nr:helix-turn-helix transcriptional regulator [Candidatus Bathyanammoxibius sp.]